MVIVLNRFDECPEFITHVAYIDHGQLLYQVRRDDESAFAELYQLLHLKTSELDVPMADPAARLPALNPSDPLVRLTGATIRYPDNTVFENLDWTIEANQHWQLSGPNGSGKTCLLSLITGDHPQCYVNDIKVFGFQRGTGESIWQIKQYIGYVSTALQWEYRVSIGLRNVIISGFYDSIGLYTKSTDTQKAIADQWLALLGMSDRADEPFNGLSYGEQRLLLIARAMVKHPPLLILDEPCLGLDDMNRQVVLALIERICTAKRDGGALRQSPLGGSHPWHRPSSGPRSQSSITRVPLGISFWSSPAPQISELWELVWRASSTGTPSSDHRALRSWQQLLSRLSPRPAATHRSLLLAPPMGNSFKPQANLFHRPRHRCRSRPLSRHPQAGRQRHPNP